MRTPRAPTWWSAPAWRTTTAAARRGVLRSLVLDAAGPRGRPRRDAVLAGRGPADSSSSSGCASQTPRLWSVETPNLYTLRIGSAGWRRTVDATDTPFGIRTIAYDKDRGFLLNGRRVKLRGVNLHHDARRGGRGRAGARLGAPARAAQGDGRQRHPHLAQSARARVPRPVRPAGLPRHGGGVRRMDVSARCPRATTSTSPSGPSATSRTSCTATATIPRSCCGAPGNEIGEQDTPDGRCRCCAGSSTSSTARIRRGRSPPATTRSTPTGIRATLAFLNALDVVGYNYVDRWHERREIFAEQDRHDHPDWKMIGTESGIALPELRRALLAGRRPAVVRPNYTSGMMRGRAAVEVDHACTTTSPATSCGPGSTTWARAPGRSRGSPPACWTSPVIPRTPTTCTRASGPIGRCSASSRTGTGPGAKGR